MDASSKFQWIRETLDDLFDMAKPVKAYDMYLILYELYLVKFQGPQVDSFVADYLRQKIVPIGNNLFAQDRILDNYAKRWRRFLDFMACLDRLFQGVDRNVYKMGLELWKTKVVGSFGAIDGSRFDAEFSHRISLARKKIEIDEELKTVVDSYIRCSLLDREDDLEWYRQKLEHLYISEMSVYCTTQRDVEIAIEKYVELIFGLVMAEKTVCANYMHPSSWKRAGRVLKSRLIDPRDAEITDWIQMCLEHCRLENIGSIVQVLVEISNDGIDRLLEGFETTILLRGQAIELSTDLSLLDLWEVYNTYRQWISQHLGDYGRFVAVWDRCFRSSINRNDQSAQIVANVCNQLLRQVDCSDFGTKISRIVEISGCLKYQDQFLDQYIAHLIERVVDEEWCMNQEQFARDKLLKIFGDKANTIELTLNDVAESLRLNREFQINFKTPESNVLVMGPRNMGGQTPKTVQTIDLANSAYYREFYRNKHKNRILSWNVSAFRVQIDFHNPCGRTCTFVLDYHQASLLLEFNHRDAWNVESAANALQLSWLEIGPIIEPLIELELLEMDRPVSPASLIRLNTMFSWPDSIIRVPRDRSIWIHMKTNSGHSPQDQRVISEALIMRTLKHHRKLSMEQILRKMNEAGPNVSEACFQLCISSLVERGFLEQDPKDQLICYIP